MRLFPSVIRYALVAASVALGACGSKPSTPPPGACSTTAIAAPDVSEAGPFHVGYRHLTVTYRPPGEPEDRTIGMLVWYPTKQTDGEAAAYDPAGNIFVDPESFLNAPPAAPLTGCGYPTIQYSHGDQGVGGGAAYLMRHFASHGWVGLAAEHTNNLLWQNVDPHPVPLYFERSTDMSALLDYVEKNRDDPLFSRVATDKVVLVGHSFGTHTVWASAGATFDVPQIQSNCLEAGKCTQAELNAFSHGVRDPRVIAGIPMAGSPSDAWFGESGLNSAHIPLLQMTGGANDVGAGGKWPRLQNDIAWVDIAGGCHESFNLVAFIGGCPSLDTEVGYKIIRTYVMAFARKHVLGDTDPNVLGIVDGSIKVSDLVTYQKKGSP